MTGYYQEAQDGIRRFFRRNGHETIIIVFATLFITLDKYHPLGSEWQSVFLYYGIFPMLVILFLLRKNPLDFGLRPGNARLWGSDVLVICLAAAAILYGVSFVPSLQTYYRMDDFKLLGYFLTSCASLAASEFTYRGFLLFGLREKFQEGSILLQMIPFALLHLGKPELETVSTIITGILFGYIAYRGRSYWPAFIIHLFINVFFVALINFKYPSPA